MTSSRTRVSLGGFAAALLFCGGALAEEPADQTGAEDSTPQGFSVDLQGQTETVPDQGTESGGAYRPATGGPTQISPTPYVDKATVAAIEPEAAQEEGDTQPDQSGMEASELNPLGADAIGLLGQNDEGLPLDLWQNSDPVDLLKLVGELPAGTLSPTANALKRRLLLSAGPFPPHFTGTPGPKEFLYARLSKLRDAGDLDSLMQMFEQIPRADITPDLARLMVEAYLLDGDLDMVCRLADDGQRAEGSSDWLKINAICLALGGKEAEARFNITMLNETGDADMPFLSLFEDVIALNHEGDAKAPADAMAEPAAETGDVYASFFDRDFYLLSDLTPLHIGLLKVLDRKVDLSLDDETVSNLILASLARWPGLSLETKLLVADEALKRGILKAEFLNDLVSAYTFSDADKQNAFLLDYQSWGLKSDALFYALAKEGFDFPDAIKGVQEGWSRARLAGRAPFIADLYFDAIKDIPADPEFLSFAPDAVRIALLSHHEDIAYEWYQMVRNQASGNAEATRMLVEMWPLMIVMDDQGAIPYSPQILRLWRRSLELLAPEEQIARAALLYEILGILGFDVPADMKSEAQLMLSGDIGVGESIGGPSLGETLLRVLIALGPEGTRSAGAFTVGDVFYTLDQAGFEDEARHIALEALMARGF